ncbi:hypothetical protein B0H17DRAFT_1216088 [Mycena rosella]|uniref:Uncharacterized protein n=1 Tax=Mycena rosella TaxID=1033263 RepID=A0AAD7CDC0_MYCRO|nr:hypothetical protein B0H17DRAFT_1216088 [Mycena rosella]
MHGLRAQSRFRVSPAQQRIPTPKFQGSVRSGPIPGDRRGAHVTPSPELLAVLIPYALTSSCLSNLEALRTCCTLQTTPLNVRSSYKVGATAAAFTRTHATPSIIMLSDLPPNYTVSDVCSYDHAAVTKAFNALSADDIAKLCAGIARAASDTQAVPHIEGAGTTAAQAIKVINNLLLSLVSTLGGFGDAATQVLADCKSLQTTFQTVARSSREHAVTIAAYADKFDTRTVTFCANKANSLADRVREINGFIDEGEEYQKVGDKLNTDFADLKKGFATFTGQLVTWAKNREGVDPATIATLRSDIEALDKQIGDLDVAIAAVSASLAATLPVTGLLALAFPLAAPFIIAGGCALAGVEVAALTSLLTGKNGLVNDKNAKKQEILTLQKEVSDIKALRTEAEHENALPTFNDNIDVLQRVWVHVNNDAKLIVSYLKTANANAGYPKYMKTSIDKGVVVYTAISKYLKAYADEIVV